MQDIEKPVLIKRVYNKNLTEQMQKTLDSPSKKSLKKEWGENKKGYCKVFALHANTMVESSTMFF